MIDWINIPALQLLAVFVTGFLIGGFFLPLWQKSPVVFTLCATMLFFFVRFIPAFFELDKQASGSIPGNGIVSAAIMYLIYVGMMQLGYVIIRNKFGTQNQDLTEIPTPAIMAELEKRE